MSAPIIDPKLIEFATVRQIEYIEAIEQQGSMRKAAKALGVAKSAVQESIARLKKAAALKGYSPGHAMTRTVPDGFNVARISTNYKADGSIGQQWVIGAPDRERLVEMMREVVAAMRDDVRPVVASSGPATSMAQLLNLYVITDYHLGAMAWGEETGANWDLAIAEQMLVDWFGAAIAQAPSSRRAVFAQLGDFLHWDGLEAVTPTSRHVLDADTRFQKLIRAAIRVIRQVVSMLLAKHEHVTLLMAEGNHDIASSAWMRELFAALYADEPRIEVITRPDPYYCIEHGATSLFFHHGHKKKIDQLASVFVAKFREIFGRTRYSYAHTGHLHHDVVLEVNTMKVEQHRTLAAPDSHSSRGGWMSGRDAKVITYHAQRGEVSRVIVSADMLEAA